ncbi:MAG: sulfurtransferase TusA family protein [Pseudomonadota bacterium]
MEELDLRGYRCPLPVIRLEAALRRADPGAAFRVLADDPVAAVDIPHFCAEGGHSVERAPSPDGAQETLIFKVIRGAKTTP